MANDAIVAGAVENLVTQFSSAFDCLRELAQNSIDAGSPAVEVWTEFQASEGHLGAASIHVDDFGEGMDESIIDNQLTCLFASSKEGDLTKIGKFGIGFVSVFALRPKAVLVHTGRGGEYWEVLFHEDRSFSKTRLDAPVEGTRVTLFVEADYHRYRELVDGALAALRKWCSHAESKVTFEDRSPPTGIPASRVTVNEPFAVPGDCLVRVELPGTEIALAYSRRPIYGFYNRGLALALTDQPLQVFDRDRAVRFRRIAAKISSRYLEHTLSRETVLRDANYERAMQLLDDAADGPLLSRLAADLRELVARPSWNPPDLVRYAELISHLAEEPLASLQRLEDAPLLRDVHGGACSLAVAGNALARDGRILLAVQPTALTRRLRARRLPILLGHALPKAAEGLPPPADDPLAAPTGLLPRLATLRKVKQPPHLLCADPEAIYLPVRIDERPPDELRPLLRDAARLLDAVEAGYRRLLSFVPESPEAQLPLFLVGRQLGDLMARPPTGVRERGRGLSAAVHREHPHVRRLVAIRAADPALAAYCLAKTLLLEDDRLLDRDVELMRVALRES